MKRLLLSLLGVLTCIHILATEQTWSTNTFTSNPFSATVQTNVSIAGTENGSAVNKVWNFADGSSSVSITSFSCSSNFSLFNNTSSNWQTFTLSSSDFAGTITSIEVIAYSPTGGTCSVTVGGNTFGSAGDLGTKQSAPSTMTFTGSESGEIVLTFKKNLRQPKL